MNDLIEWDIPQNYFESVRGRGIAMSWFPETYVYEIYEDEAFILTTYFTHVWLHAHEHLESVIPGTFPARSYAGQTMDISLGQYEISLQFNTYEIDKGDNCYTDQWLANVVDKETNDVLEINVEGRYYYNPGHIYSNQSKTCAKRLAKFVFKICESEVGFTAKRSRTLRQQTSADLRKMFDERTVIRYPEWFSNDLYGKRRSPSFWR